MSWSAKQYVVFEDERTRPVRDLLAAVPTTDVHSVIDVGCGPGNSTETLMARYPAATARGIDSSTDMIEAARKRLPKVRFDLIDIETWEDPGGFDVMLSNAGAALGTKSQRPITETYQKAGTGRQPRHPDAG